MFCVDLLFTPVGYELDWFSWFNCCSRLTVDNYLMSWSRVLIFVFLSAILGGIVFQLIAYMMPLRVTCVWKASQVAFGWSINYLWVCLLSTLGLNPQTAIFLYFAFVCLFGLVACLYLPEFPWDEKTSLFHWCFRLFCKKFPWLFVTA